MDEYLGISIMAAKKILERAEYRYYQVYRDYKCIPNLINVIKGKDTFMMQFRERNEQIHESDWKTRRSVLQGGSDLRNVHALAEYTDRLLLVTAMIESKGEEFYSRWVNPAEATNVQISRISCYKGAVGLELNILNGKHVETAPANQPPLFEEE